MQPTYGGGFNASDAFAVKFDGNGTRTYATFLGGADDDLGLPLAQNATGELVVAGYTPSVDFPVTIGALQSTNGGGVSDAFVVKLGSTGSAAFATYLGGSGTDSTRRVAMDSSGAAFVLGTTTSPNFPTTVGVAQTTAGGGQDAFVTKLSDAGTLAYSTYIGGADHEDPYQGAWNQGWGLKFTRRIWLARSSPSFSVPGTLSISRTFASAHFT